MEVFGRPFVDTAVGTLRGEVHQADFLDPDLMATVLLHLATRRRDVATIADVLDQLARNHALQPFVDLARDRLQ